MKFSVMFRLRLALAMIMLGWARSLAAYTFPSLLSVGQKITAALINNIISTIAPCDSGVVNVTCAGSSASGTATVTFAANRFSAPPLVLTTVQTVNPSNYGSGAGSVTATGATISAYKVSSGSAAVVVTWFAVVTPS